MRFNINKWQRVLLLTAAVGTVWATLSQADDYGLEGFYWLLPIGFAVALAFVAISSPTLISLEASESTLPPSEIVSSMALCNEQVFHLLPTTRMNTGDFEGYDPRLLADSLLLVRATVYSYIVSLIAAQRVDPGFHKSSSLSVATDSFARLFEKAWLRRFGKDCIDFPSDEAKGDFSKDYLRACELYGTVAARLFQQKAGQFEPLFRYLEMRAETAPSDLEKKYGPTTRKLLETLKNRFQKSVRAL